MPVRQASTSTDTQRLSGGIGKRKGTPDLIVSTKSGVPFSLFAFFALLGGTYLTAPWQGISVTTSPAVACRNDSPNRGRRYGSVSLFLRLWPPEPPSPSFGNRPPPVSPVQPGLGQSQKRRSPAYWPCGRGKTVRRRANGKRGSFQTDTRNEIPSYIVREGMTVTELVEKLAEQRRRP